MLNQRPLARRLLSALAAATLLSAPVSVLAQTKAVTTRETAVAPEVNPPGDIPDNQVFITYRSPAGFSMQVPEGWSRSDTASGVSFADKYGLIGVALGQVASSPTEKSVKQNEIAQLKADGHAIEITGVQTLDLPVGKTVAVDFTSNSAVNSVTNRKIRLENRRLYYFNAGQEAVVTLSAPAGADNVDQWKLMAESFMWTS